MDGKIGFLRELPLYQKEVPFEVIGFPDLAREQVSNCHYDFIDGIQLNDVRRRDEQISIDETGFAYLYAPSACLPDAIVFESEDDDHPDVVAYLEETVETVKRLFKASELYLIDWRFRRNPVVTESDLNAARIADIQDGEKARYKALPPSIHAHCDWSYRGGEDRLEMHLLPSELAQLRSSQKEIIIINCWRPLKTVQNSPLVLCDPRSVPLEDTIEVDKVLENMVEKEVNIFHRPYHKWYWMSKQSPEEMVVFKSWEARTPNTKHIDYPPHTSAVTDQDDDSEGRESIEVRIIVVRNKQI